MPIVALRNVSKSFGTHVVLDSVNLDVVSGEVVAVIGRSGSGKSTLLRCINGLEATDSGTIHVNGRHVTRDRAALRALHQDVGIVFQTLNLFPPLDRRPERDARLDRRQAIESHRSRRDLP